MSARSRSVGVGALAAVLAASVFPAQRTLALEGSLESVSTAIAVKLDDRLSSQDNKAGDTFGFELTGSVLIDGVPVGAGTRGHGVVLRAESGAGPHHGSLTLAARSLDLSDGSHIPVGLQTGSLDRTIGRETRGFAIPVGAAATAYVGSSRDNNVVYEKGTRFTVVSPPPETPSPDETP